MVDGVGLGGGGWVVRAPVPTGALMNENGRLASVAELS